MSALITKFQSLAIDTKVDDLSKEQQAQISQWDSILKTNTMKDQLAELNIVLRDATFVASTVQSLKIDIQIFEVVFPLIKELVASTKDITATYSQYRHILRYLDFIQRLLQVPVEEQLIINYDVELPREIIEKKKKPTAGEEAEKKADDSKKDKKVDVKPKDPKGKPDEETLKKLREEAKAKKAAKKAASANQPQEKQEQEAPKPSVIDFRVGFIQKAEKHPDADSLYVSTIDVGDEEGPRTVCSGLVKHFPLEAMQERYVVVVCNLKPVNMRGIKSTAMVLCGSTDEKVEFVEPPAGSKAGDKIFFAGFGDDEPLKQLNPKKKIWEALQPHFTTNESLEVIFKDEEDKETPIRKLTNKNGDPFKVATIIDAQVR